MKEVVIVGALRTPIGCFGTLARHSAVELGSMVVRALMERTGVDVHSIDEVIWVRSSRLVRGKIRHASLPLTEDSPTPFPPSPLTTFVARA